MSAEGARDSIREPEEPEDREASKEFVSQICGAGIEMAAEMLEAVRPPRDEKNVLWLAVAMVSAFGTTLHDVRGMLARAMYDAHADPRKSIPPSIEGAADEALQTLDNDQIRALIPQLTPALWMLRTYWRGWAANATHPAEVLQDLLDGAMSDPDPDTGEREPLAQPGLDRPFPDPISLLTAAPPSRLRSSSRRSRTAQSPLKRR